MKKILFLTSTNLASNPRLLKELQLVVSAGFDATVMQFRLGNWSDSMTDELKQQFQRVRFVELSALRRPFIPWFVSSLLEKALRKLHVSTLNKRMLSLAASKRSFLLLQACKNERAPYNWIIAHNAAAFYPAFKMAKRNSSNFGIDVEDYHPGESNNPKEAAVLKRLMKGILPFATYCSYAAPLIAIEVQKDIPEMKSRQFVVINGFDQKEFPEPVEKKAGCLHAVWFSQHINAGRGLEMLLPVIDSLKSDVCLHLIGQLDHEFYQNQLKNKKGIVVHKPMTQKELHAFLSTCDIGIACDVPVNKNRELALTNKLIAYAQAGLFIVATDTPAQKQFLLSTELQFALVDGSRNAYQKVFAELLQRKTATYAHRMTQYQAAGLFDSVKIYQPLLNLIKQRI